MNFAQELDAKGYAIVPQVIAASQLNHYRNQIEKALKTDELHERAPGLRNVFEKVAAAHEFAISTQLRQIIEPILGPDNFAVRALIFDKTADGLKGANWKVPFHQDLSIAVQEKLEAPGFSAWSVKTGVQHVQPPVEILERMLAVRLHLDDCDSENGALRVLPGSHLQGKLNATEIQQIRQVQGEEVCAVPEAGVFLMRPLLLHASSPANSSRRRRVLHLEFASEELPGNLEWQWRISEKL